MLISVSVIQPFPWEHGSGTPGLRSEKEDTLDQSANFSHDKHVS